MIIPKLTLVGAGPGDPDLITLKAIKAIKKADVVLYDALINEILLDYCSPNCEKIYVGKKGHQESTSQDSINFLIVEKAIEKGNVVRLKGGDPYIFGRGAEEINYAKQRGLETEYIPGISSIQTTGLSDVPLTSRGYSEGFWVITGHKSDKELSKDLKLAIQSNSTIVILMGMAKINQIAQQFIDENKTETPFKIIQNASSVFEKSISGQMKDMQKLVEKSKITNPAIIIIGEVVNAIIPTENSLKNISQKINYGKNSQ